MRGKKRGVLFLLLVLFLSIIFITLRITREKEPVINIDIPAPRETRKVMLYFSCPDIMGFVPQILYIETKGNVLDEAKFVVNNLIQGPKEEGLVPTIPHGTKMRELYITEGVAYPDFSREFVENHWGGTTGEIHTVYSIVNTLTLNFDEIEYVQLLVEGKQIQTLCGHLDLSRPLSPELELISDIQDAKEED